MDKIDEALSLPTFGQQFRAIKALARTDDPDGVLNDPRVKAWCRVHRDAIAEMIFMRMSEAMNDTIAAQISTPVTPAGNRRTN